MKLKSLCLASALVLIGGWAHALITFSNPALNVEYMKYSDIEVAGSTNNSACFGQSGIAKVREGHVTGNQQTGPICQEGGFTVPEEEGVFSKTLSNPNGGWPSSAAGQTPLHAEVVIILPGGDEVGTLNFYIAQDAP